MPCPRPERRPAGRACRLRCARFAPTPSLGLPLLSWLLAAPALAAGVTSSSDYLARMDADHDGRVDVAEYQDWMSYAFDAMDADHDGVLATAEQPGQRAAPITRAAHRARIARVFARLDRNHDGTLDASELAAPPR
jgi:hypothetical protein